MINKIEIMEDAGKIATNLSLNMKKKEIEKALMNNTLIDMARQKADFKISKLLK